jgi:hypothetical protein
VVISAFKPQYSLIADMLCLKNLFIVESPATFWQISRVRGWDNFRNLCGLMGLYKYKIVKVTEQFKSVVVAATLAIATYYLLSGLFQCSLVSTSPSWQFNDEYWNQCICYYNSCLIYSWIWPNRKVQEKCQNTWNGLAMGLISFGCTLSFTLHYQSWTVKLVQLLL